MKVYVTARFNGGEKHHDVEALRKAVRAAKLKDFVFTYDIKEKFNDPKQLWDRVYDELGACDALLVDVSDYPSGGRLVEVGMAFALRKPVIVVKKPGVEHKKLFDGVASAVITYKDYDDLSRQLRRYDKDRTFTVTDRSTLLVLFLSVGAVTAWVVAQFFIPLAFLWLAVYWFAVRYFVASIRAFDRVVIYIPLTAIWAGGYFFFAPLYMPLALAWAIVYWPVTLIILSKLKFSL